MPQGLFLNYTFLQPNVFHLVTEKQGEKSEKVLSTKTFIYFNWYINCIIAHPSMLEEDRQRCAEMSAQGRWEELLFVKVH
jgi:hypothetical protein